MCAIPGPDYTTETNAFIRLEGPQSSSSDVSLNFAVCVRFAGDLDTLSFANAGSGGNGRKYGCANQCGSRLSPLIGSIVINSSTV